LLAIQSYAPALLQRGGWLCCRVAADREQARSYKSEALPDFFCRSQLAGDGINACCLWVRVAFIAS
jgi:hypothetical protein